MASFWTRAGGAAGTVGLVMVGAAGRGALGAT